MTTDASKNKSDVPTGLDLMPTNEEFRENPQPILDRLRAEEPVHHDELMEAYLLTRYEDVERVLQDRSLSVDPRKTPPDSRWAKRLRRQWQAENPDDERVPSMLFLDPPDHDRLRGLVNKAFTPGAVERMRPRAQSLAHELLDKVEDLDGFDVIADFAAPFPTILIAEMLGIDSSFQAEFKRLSDTAAQSVDPFLDEEGRTRVRDAVTELENYLRDTIDARRNNREDDLITGLVEAEEDGEKLTAEEVVATVELLLGARNQTTTDLIENGVFALLDDRSQFERLRDEPSLIENAVEEMLRFDTPVMNSRRITLEDIEIGGCPIQARSEFAASLTAANHDASVHPDPHTFNIERGGIRHLSFGGGRRYCLGASLARLETQVAISTLTRRFPNLRLADQEIEHRAVPAFRGLKKLRVLS